MASVPEFCSDYQFSPDEFSDITSITAEDQSYVRTDSVSSANMSSGAISNFSCAMLGDHQDHDNSPILNDKKNDDALDILLGESEIMSAISVSNLLPATSSILDMDVPTLMVYRMGDSGDTANVESCDAGFQLPDFDGYGEDFGEFLPTFTPVCPPPGEKGELEYNQTTATNNTKTKKFGRYTAQERKERILRYLKKKDQRKYNNNIKYACRKTIAESRPRVGGRFAKANEAFEEETEVKKNDVIPHNHQETGTRCDGDALQVLPATKFEEHC